MLYKILSKIIVFFFGGAGPLCPPPVRAELYALVLAIHVVRRSKEKNFVIFSDSMSSLQSINGFNLDSDLVQKFLKDYTDDCAKPTLFLVARSHNRYTSGLSHVLRCRAAQV